MSLSMPLSMLKSFFKKMIGARSDVDVSAAIDDNVFFLENDRSQI